MSKWIFEIYQTKFDHHRFQNRIFINRNHINSFMFLVYSQVLKIFLRMYKYVYISENEYKKKTKKKQKKKKSR